MLSVMDPIEVEGVVVFRDDDESSKFYVLPDEPVIPLDDAGVPEFLFLKYLKDVATLADGQEAGGGWVGFRTVLTMKPERRQKIVDALRAQLTREQAAGKKPFGHAIESVEPVLADPVWTDGTVSLSTFKVSDTGLVKQATDKVPVDLAGSLGASMSVDLSADGAEIFWGAFKNLSEQQIPILVTYQLTYKARVASTITIHASHETIRKKVYESAQPYRLMSGPFVHYQPVAFTGNLIDAMPLLRTRFIEPLAVMIPRPQLPQVIARMITTNDITVQIDSDQGGGPGAADVQTSLLKMATDILTERIIPDLFGDNDPKPGVVNSGDTSKTVDLYEITTPSDQTATFDLHLQNRSTIDRHVNPNGAVHVLLGSDAAARSAFKELRLVDGFFSSLKVTVQTSGVDFDRDGIAEIHVFLKYEQQDDGDPQRSWVRRSMDVSLRAQKDVAYWRFDLARDASGGHKSTYAYSTEVTYRDMTKQRTPWVSTTDRQLSITPRVMGAIRVDAVLTAPKTVVDSATVELKYHSTTGSTFTTTIQLTPDANRKSWFQFTGDLNDTTSLPEYGYRVTYHTAQGDIAGVWAAERTTVLELPTPFKKTLTFTIRPQGAWDGVASIAGDFVYRDSTNGYEVRKPFSLARADASIDIAVPVLDDGPEEGTWSARVVRTDGSATVLQGRATAGTVWVGMEPNYLEITLVPDLVDFTADIELAVVVLTFRDAAHDVNESKTFTLSKTSHAQQVWRAPRHDSTLNTFDMDVRFIAYDRSKSSELHLKQIDQTTVVLDRAPAHT